MWNWIMFLTQELFYQEKKKRLENMHSSILNIFNSLGLNVHLRKYKLSKPSFPHPVWGGLGGDIGVGVFGLG
jgi:hypothetical protein